MGNIENTAINELIARASGGSMPTSPFARVAATIPPPQDGVQGDPAHTTLPVKMPVAAPFETTLPMSYPMVPRALRAPVAPAGRTPGPAWTPEPPAVAAEPAWPPPGPGGVERLDPRRLHELMHRPDRERMVPTFQMRRRSSEVRTVINRLVFPVALLVSTGIVIGAHVAFGERGEGHGEIAATREPSTPPPTTAEASMSPEPALAPAPTASAPAVPAPVEAPAAAPIAGSAPSLPAPALIATPAPADPETAAPSPVPAAAAEVVAAPTAVAAGAPALVDVRIESVPSGATVTLVDRGRTQLVGDTPVDAAVDPARAYDLVFTYADKAPHVVHLDARTTRRVSAVLDGPEFLARPVDPAPRRAERAGRESAAGRPSRARAETAAGEGTLMISSKPPCEIVIDGRVTGLTTPQRSLALPAGHHRITLLNSEQSINKTLTIQISANTTEKIIEDLMK